MKPQTADSISLRCAHRTAGGRQCRLLASDDQSGLCSQHRAAQKQEQDDDHFFHLITNFQGFQTAQGINHSLGNLYELLAQNRISPRRAAVLAYFSSLMLRTLPQIDAEVAAGITVPAKPAAQPSPAPVPEPVPVEAAAPDSATAWDPSIPEPDPNKKPS
jgi:hypothetical protein